MLSSGRAFAAMTVLFSVCLAALTAHVAIDVAGNFVLAHDAYDDLEHASRVGIVAVDVLVALGVVASAFCLAALELQGRRPELRAALEESVGRAPARFVIVVVAGSLLALLAMEAFDTFARDGHVAGLAALFGGSVALGAAVAAACSAAVAFGVWSTVRLLLRSCRALVAALDALISHLSRARSVRRFARPAPLAARLDSLSILSTNAGLRAPPLHA